MTKPWCVQHRDGWCVYKSQPKGTPRERDVVKTMCNHEVLMPWGTERRDPNCPECLEKVRKEQ